jgi:hypothetical protein
MKPKSVAAFNKLYGRYRRHARQRKIPFNLSKEDFKLITSSRCHYCNREPLQKMDDTLDKTGNYNYNGIDRVNSDGPYEKNNVVPCCGTCNRAKHRMTYKEFIDWIRRLCINASHVNERYEPVNKPVRIEL